jgi:uncharacterized protein (DUF1697 family)
VPSYVAFLRAINLGATRKFPKADIRRCVEATGATAVETHINTGNVRLTTTIRSQEKLERTLEEVFAADRGFAVPTIAFRLPELVDIGRDSDRLTESVESVEPAAFRQYVTLLKTEPPVAAAAALEALSTDGEQAHVHGRAVHVVLLERGYAQFRLDNARIEQRLGVATTRDAKVIAALVQKWC